MKVIKIIGAVSALLVAIVVVSAMVGLGNTVDKGDKTAAHFKSVRSQIHLGMTSAQIRAIAGKPEDTQSDTSRYAGISSRSDYWYYGVLSKDGYQLAFENGKLISINRS